MAAFSRIFDTCLADSSWVSREFEALGSALDEIKIYLPLVFRLCQTPKYSKGLTSPLFPNSFLFASSVWHS